MSNNGNDTEASGLTPKARHKLGVISPSPKTKTNGLPEDWHARCPFCSMIIGLPEALRRDILSWVEAAVIAL